MVSTAEASTKRWRERMMAIGLDPDRDGVNQPILLHTRSLAQYKSWFAFPENGSAEVNDVQAAKIAALPEALVRRYVTEHIANQRIFTDPRAIAAIEERVGRFYARVLAAPDITITGTTPLLINSSGVITLYNNVTIEKGGYIRITVPAKFECETLKKVQGQGAAKYDVEVVGSDGRHDTDGVSPDQPAQAAAGGDAKCDCCGGAVERNATPGTPGKPGPAGGDAAGRATDGEPGPTAFFHVKSKLDGTLSFLNRGGNGGNGARGGGGARGGQGGNGGNGTTCGAFFPDGSAGGTGGKGGNGGNGSSGRKGGKGATLAITVPVEAESNVLVENLFAGGGAKGSRGFKGDGGPGGAAGARGGSPGANGVPGDSDGQDGAEGSPGEPGTTTVNGKVV